MTRPAFQYRTVQELPAWGTASAPPKEFLIFPFGETHATKWGGKRETVLLTEANAKNICDEWARRNIIGTFDRDHDFGDSLGTFDIEVRQDGLWCISISWTDETLQKFAAKKIRYHSPAFDVALTEDGAPLRDTKGRLTITALYNIALTNYPATDNLRPLIALSNRGRLRRYNMLDIATARAHAKKVVEYVNSKEFTEDGLALMLMELATNPEAALEPPSDPAAMGADPAMPEEEKKEEEMVLQTAFSVTGLRGKACVGALRQFSSIKNERDKAVKELAQIKHAATVEQAIRDKKLAPAKRAEALSMDPEIFRGWNSLASPIVDDASLTAKTNATQDAKPEDVINPDMIEFCRVNNRDVKQFSQYWASRFPGVNFKNS